MPTIAISGFFGDDNIGDDLLQIAVIKGLQSRMKTLRVVIFTSNIEKNIALFKRESIDYSSFEMIYSGRWGLKDKTESGLKSYSWIIRHLVFLRKCDLHLIGPGNLIKDNTNKYLAAFWLLKGYLTALLGKRFAFFGIGVADVNYDHSKFLIRKILNKASFITTRDSTSLQKLKGFNVNKPPMKSFPDLTFSLKKGNETAIRKKKDIKRVGLNFANFSPKFFPGHTIEEYKNIMLHFTKALAKNNNYEFFFFSFSKVSHFNDDIMYDYVAGEMKKNGTVICNVDYKNITELKEEMSKCDAFVGTRFHSVIFAIQSHVPTLALSYDWKAKNFMLDAGFTDYFIDVDQLSLDQLLDRWESLCSNYEAYNAQIEEINLKYRDLSSRHFDMIEDLNISCIA